MKEASVRVREQGWRKGISFIRGTGFRDWGLEEDEDGGEDENGGERADKVHLE